MTPLQLGLFLRSIPWWFPTALIALGLLSYGTPSVERFLGNRLPEWRRLPRPARLGVTVSLVAGAALVVFGRLGRYDWAYVLFLLGYARAIEGVTTVHLFGRIDRFLRWWYEDGPGSDTASRQTGGPLERLSAAAVPAVEWLIGRLRSRLPLVIVTSVLSVIVTGLFGAILLGFRATPLPVKLAFVVTVSTFYLSTVTSAWVLRKVSDEITPLQFVGVVAAVVGGEAYNVPSAFSLFTSVPAVEGPLGSLTTVAVGTVGWFVGLGLGVAFFARRVRTRDRFDSKDR